MTHPNKPPFLKSRSPVDESVTLKWKTEYITGKKLGTQLLRVPAIASSSSCPTHWQLGTLSIICAITIDA
jgi:hypothetical protein